MGGSVSKPSGDDALRLCKERTQYIKQAVDSRYALSAAHLCYIQSLHGIGTALRRFVEAEVSMEPSMSASEPDKSPMRSFNASPWPSPPPRESSSPLSPRLSNMSYMKAARNASVAVTVNPSMPHFVEEENLNSPIPPPLPPGIDSSWDFFDPNDAMGSVKVERSENFASANVGRSAEVVPLIEEDVIESCKQEEVKKDSSGSNEALPAAISIELHKKKMGKAEMGKEVFAEREDASEFITHRAKDFLSSMKDIEHKFLRGAEFGNEVSRMLETRRIRLGSLTEMIGKSPSSQFCSAFHLNCCKGEMFIENGSGYNAGKGFTLNRSTSSLSSSSKHPLTLASKDDNGDSGGDFIEEFCMISGTHSSTLDRLFAWERKLYDEVKASEIIRKAYDQKCNQLRRQFARDLKAQVIDKTRAAVKDLHSQVRVAIQSVDSISKKIEKLRDEELQPQLGELIQGLIRMWKAMLECHHAQFIIISLAYHVKSSAAVPCSESYRQALTHLQTEIDCFASSFAKWADAHRSYVEALNAWIHKCILQPQEQSKGRRKVVFPPRRAILPPVCVLCSDWLDGIKSLPSKEVCDSIRDILPVLHDSFELQIEEKPEEALKDGKPECEGEGEEKDKNSSSMEGLQTSLSKVFDRLTKFSEALVKVFEDVMQGNETARIQYINGGGRL